MPTYFRHADPRYPFLWEHGPQAPARWHTAVDAPATYLADTADGAWAEFLRHEEITDPVDLQGIERRLWAVEFDEETHEQAAEPALPEAILLGDKSTYSACQQAARGLRDGGAHALRAPSAALLPGAARGQVVQGGLQEGGQRDGYVLVLFGGAWPSLRAWAAASAGAPTERQLTLVRHL